MAWFSADPEADLDELLVELWPGSADLSPAALEVVLESARDQCVAYGPALSDPDNPPRRWLMAQALQAKALTVAGFAGAQDSTGGFGETVTVYPMDWQVKNLLRPNQGKPYVL